MPVGNKFAMPTIIWSYFDNQQQSQQQQQQIPTTTTSSSIIQNQSSFPTPITPPRHHHQQQQQPSRPSPQQQQQQFQQQASRYQDVNIWQQKIVNNVHQSTTTDQSRKRMRTVSLEQDAPLHKYRKSSVNSTNTAADRMEDDDWVVIIKK
jgi:hypothetical protein